MTRLLLVNSVLHYQQLARTRPELLASHVAVTADMGVSALLEDQGRRYHELWDHLTDEELERHWDLAWQLSAEWHGLEPTDLECFGAYPLRASRVEMVTPLETALNTNRAFERLIQEVKPHEVVGTGIEAAVIRDGPPPVYRGTAAIAEAVVRWRCGESGVRFSVSEVPPPALKPRKPPPLNRQRVASAAPDEREAVGPECPLLMILDIGQNPRELFELESRLLPLRKFRVVRVSELLRSNYPLIPPLPPAVRDDLSRCLALSAEARRRYVGPYPFIFRNPHLEFQFAGIWSEIARSCEVAAFVDPLYRYIRPDALLMGVDCYTTEGLVRDIAARKGIAVGVLVHSGLGPIRSWRSLTSPADLVFCWGNIDGDNLVHYGTARDRLAMIGSLRFQDALPKLEGPPPPRRPKPLDLMTALGFRGLRPPERIVALLTTQTNMGLTCSSVVPREHRAVMRRIISWARSHREVGVLLKPHPTCDHLDWYRYLEPTLPPNVRYVESATLDEVLAVSDAAVLMNYGTTAALEAMVDTPVVFLREGYRRTPGQATALDGDAVLHAASVSELTAHLDALFTDPSFRAGCLARQRAFVAGAIREKDGKHPAVRLAEVFAAHLERRGGAAREQEALRPLWGTEPDEFAGRWRALFARVDPADQTGFLLATAVVAAAIARNPEELEGLMAIPTAALCRAGTAGAGRTVALAASMSAMIRSLNRRQWLEVLAWARRSLVRAPTATARSNLVRRVVGRAMVSHGIDDPQAIWTMIRALALPASPGGSAGSKKPDRAERSPAPSLGP
jgi:hypothetical protein